MMMRKLVVFLAAAVLLMPLGAQALGFGKIVVRSALDEPLDADIELISPTPEDITNLKIKLASPEAYMRAGIDRPYILGDLQFRIRQDDQGRYYIHVSSKKRIKEPFLNFLLEMNWQNGRMVREYTILLDPPDRIQRQPAMVEAPATQEAPAAITEPVPAPVPAPAPAAESEPVPAPVAEAPAEAVAEAPAEPAPEETFPRTEMTEAEIPPPPPVTEPEPAPVPEPVAEAPAEPAPAPAPEPMAMAEEPIPAPAAEPMPAPAEPVLAEEEEELFPRIPLAELGESARMAGADDVAPITGELDYGIVQKGDTLWKIAEKLRPNDQVSIYQVMMALLVSNPEAFVDGNMNRLKVGHVLRIDDPDIITSVNPQEAAREYRAQLQAWQDYHQSVAAIEPEATQPVIAGEAAQGETGTETATGELTLASPEGGDLQSGTGTSEEAARNELLTLREELRQLREDSAAMGTHNEALNRELQALEAELEAKQRALSISDDELAALQQQLASAREAAAEAAVAEQATRTEDTPAAPAEDAPAPEPAEATATATADTTAEPAITPEAAPAAEGEGERIAMAEPPAKSPVELAEEISRGEQRPAARPAAPMTPPAGDEGGIMNTIMGVLAGIGAGLQGAFGGMAGDSLLMFVGLPVLLVLLLIAAIVLRRRRSAENYQESILTGEPAAAAAGGAAAGAAAGPESEEESSFLSDFAVSGAGAIQTEDSEVDPLTEADVFVAYGRYEAAEERLKEAIENDPDRAELKLKLIELYHTTKNKPAFENAAEEFYAGLGDDAAENPMWQKVVAMGAELVPNNPLFSNAGSEAMVESAASVATSDSSSASLSDSQVMDIGLDTGVFDVADLGAPEQKPETPAKAEPEVNPMDSGVMDFNIDMETPAPEKAPAPETSAASEESGLDFNLDLAASDTANTEPDLAQPEASDAGLDFSLDAEPATEAPAETASTGDESALDFSLDEDEAPTAQMTTEAAAEAGLDFALDADKKDDSGALDFDLDMGATAAPAGDEDETAEMSLNLSAPAESGSDTSMAIDISDDSTATMPEPSGMDFELDATDASLDIGTGDEVGTKLDLAKAYIDMGDPDGARSILDEVLDEGNEAQKQEAQQLLQQIA